MTIKSGLQLGCTRAPAPWLLLHTYLGQLPN
uniref:Uncharacterized protein n=1 Tax=Arundo donax TaxID=35708 RepID=A0A0A9C0A6_ARUDO